MSGTFNGRHMAALLVGFFGVVIIVNLTMAVIAKRTFGGLVVDNSYVASQKFNGWLAQARAEKALGWSFDVKRRQDAHVEVRLSKDGAGLQGATVTAQARHPLGRLPEQALAFVPGADGLYLSTTPMGAGRWIVRFEVQAQGKALHHIVDLK